jgi:hypothetical protein
MSVWGSKVPPEMCSVVVSRLSAPMRKVASEPAEWPPAAIRVVSSFC